MGFKWTLADEGILAKTINKEFIRDFKDEVPGASAKDCGNYLDMNLSMANYLADKYLEQVLYNITPDRLIYPE